MLVTVADCSLTAAILKPEYINCDSFSIRFENESLSSDVSSYTWDFGVPNETTDVSSLPTPVYTYKQAGTYTVKLKVSSDAGCTDSTISTVKIYPGFKPDFSVSGSCYQSPFVFTDKTYAAYGVENKWTWNFDDGVSPSNTSAVQSPTHLYTTPKTATVTLNVGTSVGCTGTVSKAVIVNNKPDIRLPFTDTLICKGDQLPLIVEGSGDTLTGHRYIIFPAPPSPTRLYTLQTQQFIR